MSTAKMVIAGWNGNEDELKQLLKNGLHITEMQPSGIGWVVEFETEPKIGRPQKINKQQIFSMRKDGMSYASIATALGCSKTYIIKVCKQQAEYGEAHRSANDKAVKPPADADIKDFPEQTHVEDHPQPDVDSKKKTLKELRKEAGLTQKQLAEATGLKLRSIQEYENGKQGLKYAGHGIRYTLARALHCSIDDFEGYFLDE